MKFKGVSGFELLLIGTIGTLTLVAVGVIPKASFKLSFDEQILFEYQYNLLQQNLLTLMTITHDGKRVYEMLGDNALLGNVHDITFLEGILDTLFEPKCYELKIDEQTIIKKNCIIKYFITYTLPLPYNPTKLTKNLWVGTR